MTDIILRSYPENKYDRYNEYRYNRNDFKKYTEINKSRNDYEKWMEGINYKTNRKIQIGGRTHCKLGYEKFYIRGDLFIKLDGIDVEEYISITNEKERERWYYNDTRDGIIKQIQSLEKWEDYIIFENNKYGIPSIYNNIHRENNCYGVIKETYHESCRCHSCEDWGGCGSSGTQHYKCENCEYKTS